MTNIVVQNSEKFLNKITTYTLHAVVGLLLSMLESIKLEVHIKVKDILFCEG